MGHNELLKAMQDWTKGWDQANLAAPVIPEVSIPIKKDEPETEVGYVFIAATKNKEYEIDVLKDSHGKYLVDYIKEGKSIRSFSTMYKYELITHISKYISNAATKGINYTVGIDNELFNIPIPTQEKPHKEQPESKIITKLTEPQKGGIYSIIVYFSTLSDSILKKEFSDIERKIFDKIENDLSDGKSWEVLNDEQINELKRLIEKHTNLVPKEYMNYLTATGVKLIQSSLPVTPSTPTKQQRYTNQQKDIAYMSIIMLKKHFDSMPKKEKTQYTKEWIDNIDRMTQFPQPISDEQVEQIISVIKKHRRLFDEMGVFDQLGVKFAGRPPKK